jgi:predicted RNase H-like HicB family nuclease
MYRVWYWAMIDRESDGRFIASIPDLDDLAAYGHTDKDAVAHVTELASQRVRAVLEEGQPVPPRRQSSDMPSQIRSREVGGQSSQWKSGAGKRGQRRPITCPLKPGSRQWERPRPRKAGRRPPIEVRAGVMEVVGVR